MTLKKYELNLFVEKGVDMKSFKFDFNRVVSGLYQDLLDAYIAEEFVEIEGVKYFPISIITSIENNGVVSEITCEEE